MQIEIWSDIICPWCYIGKKRFDMALAGFAQREKVSVTWRSFELDPNALRQYPDTQVEMLARKYGVTLPQAEAMNSRVTSVAMEIGLEFHLNKARPGNTFDAHRLLHFATSRQLENIATERMMHAYFCEGFMVGDRMALAGLAPKFGIAESEALTMLESDAYSAQVRADETRAAELGVTGVPFFLFDEKTGISGAQSVEVLTEALQKAWAVH
ncbi:MAG: DsbA family oxidoreductase [Candidatus Nitrotoga sp.]